MMPVINPNGSSNGVEATHMASDTAAQVIAPYLGGLAMSVLTACGMERQA